MKRKIVKKLSKEKKSLLIALLIGDGIKEYTSKCGYNTGKEVLYSQFSINPTIKQNCICSKENPYQKVVKLAYSSRYSNLVYG